MTFDVYLINKKVKHPDLYEAKFKNQEMLKLFSLKILDFYGYFATQEIWDFCFDKKKEVNISQLIGVQSTDINSHFRKF